MNRRAVLSFLASFVNGTLFGGLCFAGAVDVRTMLKFIDTKSPESLSLLQAFFPVWWPYGRDFMLPLMLLGLIFSTTAFYMHKQAGTKQSWYWLVPIIMHLTIGLWTMLVMSKAIHTGMAGGNDDEFLPSIKNFCLYHMPRIFFSGVGYAFSTLALMNGKDLKTD